MANKAFLNWTAETFRWTFNGQPYAFKPGIKVILPEEQAELFAKHLVDQYMQDNKMKLDAPERAGLTAQCFPDDPIAAPAGTEDLPLDIQALNSQAETGSGKVEEPAPKKKGGRKKTDLEKEADKDDSEPEFTE